jgi:hypothetical protein
MARLHDFAARRLNAAGASDDGKRAMRAGRRPIKVTWLMITDAGRQALG